MATLYRLDIFDTNGKAIVPGVGGAHYESDTPLPIPRVGELIFAMGREFTVENVTYEYIHEEKPPHRFIAAAKVVCRPNAE